MHISYRIYWFTYQICPVVVVGVFFTIKWMIAINNYKIISCYPCSPNSSEYSTFFFRANGFFLNFNYIVLKTALITFFFEIILMNATKLFINTINANLFASNLITVVFSIYNWLHFFRIFMGSFFFIQRTIISFDTHGLTGLYVLPT